MDSPYSGIIELGNSVARSRCEHWREHPFGYAIKHAIRHAIESDNQQLVYETLVDPDFRKLRNDKFGVNSLRTDILSAMEYFSSNKHNLLRYYQILFLGQQIDLFPRYRGNAQYQNYCQAYLQFLQLNEPPNWRKNIGISRVLNRLFPIEFNQWDRYRRYEELPFESGHKPEIKDRLELTSYEIGNWRCKCGFRQGHTQRYDLECRRCKIRTGNGVIDEDEETCSCCAGPITYVTCSECNTRVTLDALWRIESGNVHPREMAVPLKINLRRFVDGSPQDITSLTLLQLPIMLGISEKSGTLHFDFPGVLWIDIPDKESPFFILTEDKKYDRQTEPLKVFEALLSRTFRTYKYPKRSLKSLLQRKKHVSQESFTQGFSQRIARIAQAAPPILTDFAFDCLVSATDSLNHNMAIINRNSVLSKNLMASFVDHKIISLSNDDIITRSPLGQTISTRMDDDGIVIVGTLVNPGDILVGIERAKAEYELTAEEKLLKAIFGEKAKEVKDASFVYDGIASARVISVDVHILKKAKDLSFHSYLGKTIRQTEFPYNQNVKTRISISLLIEQPIEIGDILYADDGSKVVICRMANGIELKNLAGCAEEPDLIVSTTHSWVKSLPETSSKSYQLKVNIIPDTSNRQSVRGRSSGDYALIDNQPLWQVSNYNVAQVMTKDDFSWLLNHNLTDCIFELLHMHSDRIDIRARLYDIAESSSAVKNRRFSLGDICDNGLNPPTDLVNAPGETIRYLAFLLRGLGVSAGIELIPKPMIRFHAVVDPKLIRSWSYGEVTKPESINYRTFKPEKDGLFCERIFGPIRDWECYCGKYKQVRFKGIVCDKCGVEVAPAKVRRERMGHIELASPVGHIWYFKGTHSLIGLLLDLSPHDLECIFYFALYVVTSVDDEARQRELMRLDEEIAALAQDINGRVVERVNNFKCVAETVRNAIAEYAWHGAEEVLPESKYESDHLGLGYQGQIDSAQSDLAKERTEACQRLDQLRRDLEGLKKMDLLPENRYRELKDNFPDVFRAGMGAEAIYELIASIDLEKLSGDLHNEISSTVDQCRKKATQRREVVEAFLNNLNSLPEWMILTVVPVLPPDLRPMVQLDDGRFMTSDLNDLYRRVINQNNRLKRILELGAPEIVIRNDKRRLQETVDVLFNNLMLDKPIKGTNGINLFSLSGHITQFKSECSTLLDMLLKRPLDYTARTRITVEHTDNIDLAFLPESLAYELFSPFIVKRSSDTSKIGPISNSDETVENKINDDEDISSFDYSKFAILISTDSPSLRFIALRFRPTYDLTLKVHSDLMEKLLGWKLLERRSSNEEKDWQNKKAWCIQKKEALRDSCEQAVIAKCSLP